MERTAICMLSRSDGTDRQRISYDPTDGHLYSDAMTEPAYDLAFASLAEAEYACDVLWNRSQGWTVEWIEREEE